jgi:hypothetical protein
MKSLVFAYLLFLVIIASIGVVAFSLTKNLPKRADSDSADAGGLIRSFEFEGHKYLSHYSGGVVHVESCQCKTK